MGLDLSPLVEQQKLIRLLYLERNQKYIKLLVKQNITVKIRQRSNSNFCKGKDRDVDTNRQKEHRMEIDRDVQVHRRNVDIEKAYT